MKDRLPDSINTQDFVPLFERIEYEEKHFFITGRAGTGKSTFLLFYRQRTGKNLVVLAPTGVAALNIKGQTIHSFFNFRPDITVDGVRTVRFHPKMKKVYQNLDTIIIDEISMVRADLLDCIDAFLRMYGPRSDKPFGGVQMIFIGDLYQLAPVVRQDEQSIFSTMYDSPYFFSAKSLQKIDMHYVELEQSYRQKDDRFIDLLNRIRTNAVEQEDIDAFNERYQPDFEPDMDKFFIYLTTTNRLADQINERRLNDIDRNSFSVEGVLKGEFDTKFLPTHANLDLKIGSQVMLLNNDTERRWVNGSIGKILDLFFEGETPVCILVELSGGRKVEVTPFTWELFQFYYDEETETIEARTAGSFQQFPLKLAWAVTIHKGQGKTFDHVIVDIGEGTFCHGQLYVALSRCTTLEGIVLKRPISRKDVFMDARIAEFLTQFQYQQAAARFPLKKRQAIIETALTRNQTLEITYLKENNQKFLRRVIPRVLRQVEHKGEPCLGLEAFCLDRQANWVFRLPCITDIKVVDREPV
ncbi:MAG: AAA family ATPase [Candidatus Omnitrophica bacterium]|nr:AAA family ATPase [Candidatus Omnitrophota bacterium]HPB67355.1 AAA family ATPase [Candidatus Omnitrophota bacterium]